MDNDWPAVCLNITKARKSWAMVSRILRRDGATPRVSSMFYKAIVQSKLLYGSESWVLTPTMLKALEGFHNRVARQISGEMPRLEKGSWVYPPIHTALGKAGLHRISVYISRRRGTVMKYVQERPIWEACVRTARLTGSPTRTSFWWEPSVVDSLTIVDDSA